MSGKQNKIIKWLNKKFQLFLYNGVSYHIIWKIKFNILGFISALIFSALILLIISYFIISYSGLRYYIPDYPSRETKKLIIQNSQRTDSIMKLMNSNESYLKMLKDLIFNEIPIDENFFSEIQNLSPENIKNFNNPLLIVKTENNENTITNNDSIKTISVVEIPTLFTPLKGIIISTFDISKKHYGIDIAASGGTTIHAVANGVVLVADYTVKDGFTILIQHDNNLISIYKHNKSLLVNKGQTVNSGDIIAIYGNSGENSTGQHLHFELWKNCEPVNPKNHINF